MDTDLTTAAGEGGGPGHQPVLAEQVVTLLDPRGGQIMLDCTVGRAGHAVLLIPKLVPGGRYIGLDVDPANIAYARDRLAGAPVPVDLRCANFADARQVLDELGVGRVDLILADLGFASSQMDDPQRGLSFNAEGPLDMRLNPQLGRTAADLVNTLPQGELADLIYEFGQERRSRKIAQKIAETRQKTPIKTTGELARIVRAAFGHRGRRSGRGHRIDPATRTFMALRIAVNAELEALQTLLDALPTLVAPGGTAAVISFHSLEDRRVKQAFNALHQSGRAVKLTRKPCIADDSERARNRRSRSAKLRAVRFMDETPPANSNGPGPTRHTAR